jgi:hypothetical protein
VKKTCRYIFLTKGAVTSVDFDDYNILAQFKWCLSVTRKNTQGYAVRYMNDGTSKGCLVSMHRQIMGLPVQGRERVVDHINGNRLDNRRCNLRIGTTSQNLANIPKRKTSRQAYKGIQQRRSSGWIASITVAGKRTYLGYFATPEEAARAYDKAALALRGTFSKGNFGALP